MSDASSIPQTLAYELPSELIAQQPAEIRDASRLLLLRQGRLSDRRFHELPGMLREGDLLVVNDSRVMSARCHFRRASGGRVELLFLEPGPGAVCAMLRPCRRLKAGERLQGDAGAVRLLQSLGEGLWRVETKPDPASMMAQAGQVPLPPYIERSAEPADRERYQTVFAGPPGSAAAPTAGLHFSEALLRRLAEKGVELTRITLHVGPGTFRPLRERDLQRGTLHPETWHISEEASQAIHRTRARGGRIIAVGTTAVRTLESAAIDQGCRTPQAARGSTRLFIRPGFAFQVIDGLITNFHLPGTSLLLLVAALTGEQALLAAYRHAIRQHYRFYSYGDAMLVL